MCPAHPACVRDRKKESPRSSSPPFEPRGLHSCVCVLPKMVIFRLSTPCNRDLHLHNLMTEEKGAKSTCDVRNQHKKEEKKENSRLLNRAQ